MIGHIEHDLGPVDEAELQSRICTIGYAIYRNIRPSKALEGLRIVQ